MTLDLPECKEQSLTESIRGRLRLGAAFRTPGFFPATLLLLIQLHDELLMKLEYSVSSQELTLRKVYRQDCIKFILSFSPPYSA